MKSQDKAFKMLKGHIQESRSYFQRTYDQYRSDREFYSSPEKQWDADALYQRTVDGKPALTINLLPPYINNIMAKILNAKIGFRVQAKDLPSERRMKPSQEMAQPQQGGQPPPAEIEPAMNDYRISEVYNALLEQLCDESRFEAQLEAAIEQYLTGGISFMCHEVADDPTSALGKRLLVRHVRDPMTVYVDPNVSERGFSDMRWGFQRILMPRADAQRMFPNMPVVELMQNASQEWDLLMDSEAQERTSMAGIDESKDGNLAFTRAWWKEPKDVWVLTLQNGEKLRFYQEPTPEQKTEVQMRFNSQAIYVDPVKAGESEVAHCIMMGYMGKEGFLKEPMKIPGNRIPLYPMLSFASVMGDREVLFKSAIYNMRDVQMQYNHRQSHLTYIMGQMKARLIASSDQLSPDMKRRNEEDEETIIYDPQDGTPPPTHQFPGGNPTTLIKDLDVLTSAMHQTIGLHPVAMGQDTSPNASGVAVGLHQQAGDANTQVYRSSVQRCVHEIGMGLMYAIPDVYTQEQVLRIDSAGHKGTVLLNARINEYSTDIGASEFVQDLQVPVMDLTIRMTPRYEGGDMRFLDGVMQLVRSMPELGTAALPLLLENLGLPHTEELTDALLANTQPSMLSAAQRERVARLPKPEPTIDQTIAKLEAEAKIATAEAKKLEAQAMMTRSDLSVKKEGMNTTGAYFKALSAGVKAEETNSSEVHRMVSMMTPIIMQLIKKEISSPPIQTQPAQQEQNPPLPT